MTFRPSKLERSSAVGETALHALPKIKIGFRLRPSLDYLELLKAQPGVCDHFKLLLWVRALDAQNNGKELCSRDCLHGARECCISRKQDLDLQELKAALDTLRGCDAQAAPA